MQMLTAINCSIPASVASNRRVGTSQKASGASQIAPAQVSTPVFVGMIAATGILLIPMLCVLRCPGAYERNLLEQERGLVCAFAAMQAAQCGTMLIP